MDDVVLRRSLNTPPLVDYDDKFYGDQESQIDAHNGEVSVEFKDGCIILAMIINLSSGVEGAGNYIIFHNDRIVFISDAYQLGVQQFVEIHPSHDSYSFIPSLAADEKMTSRVILKTNFTNLRNAISQNKPSKTKKRSIVIKKERGRPDLFLHTAGVADKSANHTISCSIISHPPLPPSCPDIDPIWTGSVQSLIAALSPIISSKADTVHTYIRSDGKGIYFYSYYATSGHGTRGMLGEIDENDFRSEAKNTRLIPLSPHYIVYKLNRVGLKTLQKLSAEKPGDVSLRCVSETTISLQCSIDDGTHMRTYYFS